VIADEVHLQIGLLAFDGLDQIDLTGPFEVLARLPNATTRIFAKSLEPVRDVRGLRLLPDATFSEAPQLDVEVEARLGLRPHQRVHRFADHCLLAGFV
jgi:cyclohexyl-isocyanide hydratase